MNGNTEYSIIPYSNDLHEKWDKFVEESINGTFLHTRRFLEYHRERFFDKSIIISQSNGEWVGLLPCAQDPTESTSIVSHPGATFGGVVHTGRLTGSRMLQCFRAVEKYFAGVGYSKLAYRPIPHIYHKQPASDDIYALYRSGANLSRRNLSTTIDLSRDFEVSNRRRRTLRNAIKEGLEAVSIAENFDDLWRLIEKGLLERHGVRAVHSFEEIQEIKNKFPESVKIFAALKGNILLGGLVLFNSENVCHVQYSVASAGGQECGAMDILIDAGIKHSIENNFRYFDFGISTTEKGRVLNEGLEKFKSEFGGGGVCYEEYILPLGLFH